MFRVKHRETNEVLEVYGTIRLQYGTVCFVVWDKSNKRWLFVDVSETELVED